MRNPFVIESALGISELVDRADEVNRVQQTIRDGGKLFVIGPRRYGKTSILRAATEQLQADGVAVLMLNVEGYTSLDLLVRALIASAAGISGNLKQAAESVRKFFGALNPSVSYNPMDGSFSASLGIKTPEASEQAPLLVDALNSLERMATSSKQRIGVILDEFQHLLKLGGPAVEGQLRAAVQMHRSVGYVFAGSQTTLITEMVSDHARPFYRLGENLFVGPVPRPDFLKSLKRGFGRLKCQVETEALTLILNLAEDVPYNVQALARACWQEAANAGLTTLTSETVAAVHQAVVNGMEPIYAPQWVGLTSNQQKALAAVARFDGKELLSRAVLRTVDLAPGTMQKSLAALEGLSILRREYQRESLRYRFEDPFFKAWIKAATVSS